MLVSRFLEVEGRGVRGGGGGDGRGGGRHSRRQRGLGEAPRHPVAVGWRGGGGREMGVSARDWNGRTASNRTSFPAGRLAIGRRTPDAPRGRSRPSRGTPSGRSHELRSLAIQLTSVGVTVMVVTWSLAAHASSCARTSGMKVHSSSTARSSGRSCNRMAWLDMIVSPVRQGCVTLRGSPPRSSFFGRTPRALNRFLHAFGKNMLRVVLQPAVRRQQR